MGIIEAIILFIIGVILLAGLIFIFMQNWIIAILIILLYIFVVIWSLKE